MRWFNKYNKEYLKDGESRIVKRFLFFPKYLCNREINKYEYRWLEFAYIKQFYHYDYGPEYLDSYGGNDCFKERDVVKRYWKDSSFATEEETK